METNEMLFYFLLHLVLSSISLNMNICLNREYVVDLIGEPGNVHDPDSSINGSVRFSVPSPFQISHLKEFQQPYMDCDIKCQLENSNYTFAHPSGVYAQVCYIMHCFKVCHPSSMHTGIMTKL